MSPWKRGALWAFPLAVWLGALLGPLAFAADVIPAWQRQKAQARVDASSQDQAAAEESERDAALLDVVDPGAGGRDARAKEVREAQLEHELARQDRELVSVLTKAALLFLGALGALVGYKSKVPLTARATWRGLLLAVLAAAVLAVAGLAVIAVSAAGAIHG